MCFLTTSNTPCPLGKRQINLKEQEFEIPPHKLIKTQQDIVQIQDPTEEETPAEQIPKENKPVKLKGFLIACAQRGNLEKMKTVMEDDHFEVDIAEDRMGCTALHYACFYKHMDIVTYLVNAGAPVDVKNGSGRTPISWAVEKKAYDIVAFLLESEADPSIADRNGIAPLHIAAKSGDYKMVETLLSINTETEEWTKLNAKTNEGFTAASFAAYQGNYNMLVLLYEYGADFGIVSSESKISPLHRAASQGHLKVVRYLLDNGADIDGSDSLGRTAVHMAVNSGQKDLLQILLSYSPQIISDEDSVCSLIECASVRNNTDVAQLLQSCSAENTVNYDYY
eukprot:CAMPEP_0117079938 /NCGR_PEP_ID=MMETSP0472-20121206/56418_1 /TAXON_ID=693140 ORGANISM="Tiarina fusus, Strain LIS" /NCGR_SAMPLE_ID=MMETSP0472 /ASSEMBLY_ACC=CAM_ASM_000603 /LENGTH=337 /DNA_ID=CAMNT_0004807407 /DNA_START=42 /DNA_END=1055 /DNA_ORIENTATION=-